MACHHPDDSYEKIDPGIWKCEDCGALWLAPDAVPKDNRYVFKCDNKNGKCRGEMRHAGDVASVAVYRCDKCHTTQIEP